MAFNWAGAAGGVQDALQQALKMELLQRESNQRQQQLDDNAEWRKMQAEQNRMANESLVEERQARIGAAKSKEEARAQRIRWAQGVVGFEGPQDPADETAAFNRARAQYILSSGGDDLPDAAVTAYLKPRPSKLLTPDEAQQTVELEGKKAAARAKYRSPSAAGAIAKEREERRKANIAMQEYVAYMRRKHEGNPEAALREFDTSGDASITGRGYVDIADYRRLLERTFNLPSTPRTPKQRVEDKLYADYLAGIAEDDTGDDDDDLSGR